MANLMLTENGAVNLDHVAHFIFHPLVKDGVATDGIVRIDLHLASGQQFSVTARDPGWNTLEDFLTENGIEIWGEVEPK